jgi:putative ABC transport system permease protein
VWSISLRDLQFRMRRVVIAVIGTGLVFSLGLVGSGLSQFFRAEVDRTVDAIGAEMWIVPAGVSGPFTTTSLMPETIVDQVRSTVGVTTATGVVLLRGSIPRPGKALDTNVIGAPPRALGAPTVSRGAPPRGHGEAAIDETAGFAIGEIVTLDGKRLRITGLTSGQTFNAGLPTLFITLRDAQTLAFRGSKMVNAILVRGTPVSLPPTVHGLSTDEVRTDILRPLASALSSIDFIRFLMWLVAATIIGAIVYLSALERLRDFAVLRAVGSSSLQLFGGLVFQAVVVSVLSAVVSLVISRVMAPAFPLPIEIPSGALLILPAVAIAVGIVASLAGLRRSMGVDPALAFGGP